MHLETLLYKFLQNNINLRTRSCQKYALSYASCRAWTILLDGSILPKYNTEAVVEYRISQGKVIKKLSTFINEYDFRTVFDVKNWSCTRTDDSETFGAEDGIIFSDINIEKYPHLNDPRYALPMQVSLFRHITTQCQWSFTDGFVGGVLGCALEPFTL